MRERPQFFKDLDRELGRCDPEAAPDQPSGQVSVQAITRQFYQPGAYQAQLEATQRYCRNVQAEAERRQIRQEQINGMRNSTGMGAMIAAQQQQIMASLQPRDLYTNSYPPIMIFPKKW